ncbi:MAG: hypothetical protein LEGION0403_FIIPPAGN_02715 [Legionella sp.]|uniref:DUF6088 family protein n=1 Tax=Legionella sp. TaxID=459 RepID=UPI003D141DE0
MNITTQVENFIQRKPRGEPFTTSSMIKIGKRPAVDQALSRLTKSGEIVRITQGVYVRPEKNRFVGIVMPEPFKVAKAIARQSNERIQISGAEAARKMGLTTQTPAQPVFFTTGRNRHFKMGTLEISLKHVSRKKLPLPNSEAGLAIQALWHLGKEKVSIQSIQIIQSRLTSEEFNKFVNAKNEMPGWMSNIIIQYEKEN